MAPFRLGVKSREVCRKLLLWRSVFWSIHRLMNSRLIIKLVLP